MKALLKPITASAVGLSLLISASGFAMDYVSKGPLSQSCTNELEEYQKGPTKVVLVVGQNGDTTIFPPYNTKLQEVKFPLPNDAILGPPYAFTLTKYHVNPDLALFCWVDQNGHKWCI